MIFIKPNLRNDFESRFFESCLMISWILLDLFSAFPFLLSSFPIVHTGRLLCHPGSPPRLLGLGKDIDFLCTFSILDVPGRKIYIRLVSYYVECRKMDGGRGRGVGASLSLVTFFLEYETAGAFPFSDDYSCMQIIYDFLVLHKSCQVMS